MSSLVPSPLCPVICLLLFLLTPPPLRSTLFPYTTLFRSSNSPPLPPRPMPNQTISSPANWSAGNVARSSGGRSEEHTSELQSLRHLVCRLLLEKKKKITRHEESETGVPATARRLAQSKRT